MKPIAVGLVCAALAGAVAATAPRPAPVTGADMAAAAHRFLATLEPPQRGRAQLAFADSSRHDWHFVPRARTGLPLREMNVPQRAAAHDLLQSATSTTGYLKATGVMQLERILGELESRPQARDPEGYHFWIFGTPSDTMPWGWRIEGHHLSVSFTAVTGDLVVATPAFLGANPARVPSGPFTGWRVLGAEEDLGRALVRSLTGPQRARAVIAAEAPRDIITGASRQARLERFEGLPFAEMTAPQRAGLLRLLREYVENMEPGIAARRMAAITDAGLDRLHFAWAGSTEPGQGHYYRIHGPTVLIEYDNTQNEANHVHSVWRDLRDDFGDDLLRRHYETAPHHRPGARRAPPP